MITFTKNLPATLTLNEGVSQVLDVQATSDDPSAVSYDFNWTLNGAPVIDWAGSNTISFNSPTPGQYDGIVQVTVTALDGGGDPIESDQSVPMTVTTIPDEVLINGRTLSEHLRMHLLGHI